MRLLGMIEALKTQEQDPTNRELSFPPSPLGALSIAISALAETATVIMYVANSKPLVEFPSRARPWPLHGGNADDRRMDEECMNVGKTEESHTGFLGSGLGDFGWPARNFDTELLGVLRVEPRRTELHRLASNDAADGSSAEKVIQNIETKLPPGSHPLR